MGAAAPPPRHQAVPAGRRQLSREAVPSGDAWIPHFDTGPFKLVIDDVFCHQSLL